MCLAISDVVYADPDLIHVDYSSEKMTVSEISNRNLSFQFQLHDNFSCQENHELIRMETFDLRIEPKDCSQMIATKIPAGRKVIYNRLIFVVLQPGDTFTVSKPGVCVIGYVNSKGSQYFIPIDSPVEETTLLMASVSVNKPTGWVKRNNHELL